MTNQPIWREIAQLGDADPVSYGGYFIYQDETGVYAPEGEWLASPDTDDAPEGWTVHRFSLDRCTYTEPENDGGGPYAKVLSDNPYHPFHPAWFADDLHKVADFIGESVDVLREWFCSEDIQERAFAYRAIGEYHGFDNLDGYPLTFKRRKEVERRYAPKQEYEVVVGNIGTVYTGHDRLTALKHYRSYREMSRRGTGSAGAEDVTLFKDREIEKEHVWFDGRE